MPNLLEIVSNLAESFDRLNLRYAVGGAIANGFWGIVRTTKDVDCLVAIPAIFVSIARRRIEFARLFTV
jgi:hypothetical protein